MLAVQEAFGRAEVLYDTRKLSRIHAAGERCGRKSSARSDRSTTLLESRLGVRDQGTISAFLESDGTRWSSMPATSSSVVFVVLMAKHILKREKGMSRTNTWWTSESRSGPNHCGLKRGDNASRSCQSVMLLRGVVSAQGPVSMW